ncbi:11692_t:CDS:10, partial [Entrophospora sp. SA101]
ILPWCWANRIDERDTAKLTKNRVDQNLEKEDEETPSIRHEANDSNRNINVSSSLKHSKSLSRMSDILSRASTRVVNLANISQEQFEKAELKQSSQASSLSRRSFSHKDSSSIIRNRSIPADSFKQQRSLNHKPNESFQSASQQFGPPLLGNSLYIFSPTNSIRIWCFELLSNPWAEIVILSLILLHILLLVIDAWNPVNDNEVAPMWSQSIAMEITARIIVSGLIINPKKEIRSIAYDELYSEPKNSQITSSFNSKQSHSHTRDGSLSLSYNQYEQFEKAELKQSSQASSLSRRSFSHKDSSSIIRNRSIPADSFKQQRSLNHKPNESFQSASQQFGPPLLGNSLYIFSPTNSIRIWCFELLSNPWAEIVILSLILLHILLLVIDAWNPVNDNEVAPMWSQSIAMEITARIIVSGLIINPKKEIRSIAYDELYSEPKNSQITSSFNSKQSHSHTRDGSLSLSYNQYGLPNTMAISISDTAFLRHTFNRIDLIAVCSFWIHLIITLCGVQHFYLLRALSTLRSLRLLSITSGSATILHIIGTQAFQGSFLRHCVWINPANNSDTIEIPDKHCGGFFQINDEKNVVEAVGVSLQPPKGFICPLGQICMETSNPYNKMISFDNFGVSMILVFVISSIQNWSYLMYSTMDSEYGISCLYFIVAVIILNFWLVNLFVAVITKMFAKIRDDTSHSAFTLSKSTPVLLDDAEGWKLQDGKTTIKPNILNRIMIETKYLWVFFIFIDLFIMAFRKNNDDGAKTEVIDRAELVFTIIFSVEILLRFFSYFPKLRLFFDKWANIVDLTLVIITLVIQIPFIKNSPVYVYMTVFQIARIYRVVIAVPRLRNLLVRVLGSLVGLVNLILFIIIVNFIAAIIGVQLLRGVIPYEDDNDFDGIPNTMNFSDIFNGFIAFYQTAEEEKHKIQIKKFKNKSNPKIKKEDVIDRWNFYRYFQAKPKALYVENIPSNLILHTQKRRVREFLNDNNDFNEKMGHKNDDNVDKSNSFIKYLQRCFGINAENDQTPLFKNDNDRRSVQFDEINVGGNNDGFAGDTVNERHAEIFLDDYQERRAMKADFIAAHPNYNASLWFLSPNNRIRRYCQLLVPSSYGERIYGTRPNSKLSLVFDGFLLTPNAYLLNVWNQLDFAVLITLFINLIFSISTTSNISVSRAIRAFKALRALRLINLSSSIKNTFHAILIAGAPRILDAALLSISLIIPFAIYGQNIFSGLFFLCNDTDSAIVGIDDCKDEYQQIIYNQLPVLTPRIWDNPYSYNFDDFQSSLRILFEIVSGEGWINVMTTSMNIKGKDLSPVPFASKWNSLFFMVYNLAGAVFVLTLFISVIISNYQSKSGAAYLTSDQNRWIDLQKILKQIKPSKRPKIRPFNKIRRFCYDLSVEKRGILSKIMTGVYILHILLLLTESKYFEDVTWYESLKSALFTVFIIIYIIDIVIKITGLGWNVFRSNRWNLFDLVVVTGAAVTNILDLIPNSNIDAIKYRKIFLILIAFKLFQKSDVLNHSSIPSIFNLFAVWSIVFVVYAIMFMEIFGLTRYGPNSGDHINFRNFPTAMITLFRMVTGEGWNSIMYDYKVESPFCVSGEDFLQSDCGSQHWAHFLFISWNVLSMYIFANMFIVVVTNNFSYCYQIAAEFSLVNRDEIRKFKKVWGEIDINRTGYIKSEDFGKFFSIHKQFDLSNLSNVSHNTQELFRQNAMWGSSKQKENNTLQVDDIDVRKLEHNLLQINQQKEALISVERDGFGSEKGVSFTNMLLMLSHYKLIDDEKSLEKEKLEKVADNVNRDRVRSLLRTIYWHKKFKALKEEKILKERMSGAGIPTIMVNDMESQNLRVNTDDIDGTHSPSFIGSAPSPLSFNSISAATTPGSTSSPGSPMSMNSDHHISDYFITRTSSFNSNEFSNATSSVFVDGDNENSNNSDNNNSFWNSIDSNSEIDDQTANQLFNSLQNNYWHGMHLNDSTLELGSNRDRHQNIGEGHLGLEAFRLIMNDDRLNEIPLILETPLADDKTFNDWKKEIELLYGLVGKKSLIGPSISSSLSNDNSTTENNISKIRKAKILPSSPNNYNYNCQS